MAVDGTSSSSSSSPRSVADATRFTTNNPHAKAKRAPSSAKPAAPSSRPATAPRKPLMTPGLDIGSGMPNSSRATRPETLDERVKRLRAAHLAARNHDVSRLDRIINYSRKYFDVAHRFTVMGLIGFSGLALLVTVYATVDMMIYNRKRREEFFALQTQLQADSLGAARLAYMKGMASKEQIAMVEEATAKAKQAGLPLPSLLQPTTTSTGARGDAAPGAERTVGPGEFMTESSLSAAASDAEELKTKSGLKQWLFGGLKKEDSAALGFRGQEEAVAASSQTGREYLKDKAKSAFEAERENQKRGGPLDQVGLDGNKKKSGWWWWW